MARRLRRLHSLLSAITLVAMLTTSLPLSRPGSGPGIAYAQTAYGEIRNCRGRRL